MDGQRFDDLTRALGTGSSRRAVIKGLAGSALAALGAAWGSDGAVADHDCRHHGASCARSSQCCSGRCKKKRGANRGKCVCLASAPTECGADACCTVDQKCCPATGACIPAADTCCVAPTDCPGSDTDCRTRTCTGGVCGAAFTVAGTPTSSQTTGDCQRQVCDGAGGVTTQNDDTDVPDDTNGCTIDTCSNGSPTHTPKSPGTECGANGVCNASGICVGCLHPSDCPTPGPCDVQTCEDNTCGTAPAPSSTVCRAATGPCDIAEFCSGSSTTCPADAKRPNGAACTPAGGGSGTCQNGACQPCPTGQTACGGACVQEGASCTTQYPGICSTGTIQCVGDRLQCVPGVAPGSQTEICNGLDDDCDGVVDEGFDLQTDVNNCGECGHVCAFDNATAACVEGTCQIDACDAGFANCDDDPTNGCETNTRSDPFNCGRCGDYCQLICGRNVPCEEGICQCT